MKLPADRPDLPEVRIDYTRYLVSLRELGQGFGLITQLLQNRGIEENAMVIFMGNNGKTLCRGKGTLFDRGTHVPLMIPWHRRLKPGLSSSALVCGTDLGPTILTACGMLPLKGMTDISLLRQLLDGQAEGRQDVFAESRWHWGSITRTDGFDLSRSIISERRRYIYNALPDCV